MPKNNKIHPKAQSLKDIKIKAAAVNAATPWRD